jgi:hypothetical protein
VLRTDPLFQFHRRAEDGFAVTHRHRLASPQCDTKCCISNISAEIAFGKGVRSQP